MPKKREDARSKHGPSDNEEALRSEVRRLKAANRKLRREAGDREYLIEQVTNRIQDLGKLPKIRQATRIKPKEMRFNRPLSAMLFLADPHMEEVVDPAETEGMAAWNFDRFLRSLWYTISVTIRLTSIMRTSHEVPHLYVNLLGDFVTGEIHPDVYYTNAFYLPDALTAGPWYLAQAMRELSAHFDDVQITGIPGNHGRMDAKPTSKRSVGRNWDTALYQNAAVQTARLPNIAWNIPRSPKCVVEANGWYFLLQHGDQVAQHGGTLPYYGMSRQRSSETARRLGVRVRDVEKRRDEGLLFDYDVRGHHHQYGTVEERTLLCPSMMGSNEFSMNRTFTNKQPGARLCFVDEEHGIAPDWRINLDDLPGEHEFVGLPQWDT